LGIGDWGLGIGDWGLAQSPIPIPNPQSPEKNLLILIKILKFFILKILSKGLKNINFFLNFKL